jgi:hypothetical protein
MAEHDITHREIYDRLVNLETKVDRIETNTKDVVSAFNAAAGAFTVLEMLGKVAKPLLWIGGCVTAVGILWQNYRVK